MRNRNIAFIILGSAALIVVLAFVGRWAMLRGPATTQVASSVPSPVSTVPTPSVPDTGGNDMGSGSKVPTSTVITQADSNKTVTLKIGSRFLLKLGDTENWTVNIGDPSVVRRVPGVLVVRGAQGLFEVLREGTTTISAEGRPNCAAGEMCAQYIIDFSTVINGV